MLLNLTIALSVVVVELVALAVAGVFSYDCLKQTKNKAHSENSFSEVEQEDLIALSQELSKTNKEMFDHLEKLDETARQNFSPGMGAMRRGYQEALESMKMGASSLMSEPPNIAMACQAFLEANRVLMHAMADATRDLAGQGLPVDDEEPVEEELAPEEASTDETEMSPETNDEVLV